MSSGTAELTVEEARERVERAWFFPYRGLTLADVEPTSSKGYWRIKKPCGGRGECSSPLHWGLGCEGPTNHTVSYTEHGVRDERGRFVSPFRVWRILHEQDGEAS